MCVPNEPDELARILRAALCGDGGRTQGSQKAPEPEGFCPGCGIASNGQCPACREMQQESARLNRDFHS